LADFTSGLRLVRAYFKTLYLIDTFILLMAINFFSMNAL